MEIFGIGLPELLLIAVVVLVVVSPERLPEAARTIGRGVADFRRAIEPARGAWRDLTSEITSVGNEVSGTVRNVGSGAIAPTNGRPAAIKAPLSGEVTTAIPTDNPWTVHPITKNMTDEERSEFMATGTLPPHIQEEFKARSAPDSDFRPYTPEIIELDYPMPHHVPPPVHSASEPVEEISYPEPTPPSFVLPAEPREVDTEN